MGSGAEEGLAMVVGSARVVSYMVDGSVVTGLTGVALNIVASTSKGVSIGVGGVAAPSEGCPLDSPSLKNEKSSPW